MSAAKPKVAIYWCASCGGCEETIVDLDEKILDVVAAVDIVLWPVALDFKYSDIEALPDGSITASLINGAIRTTEQEHVAKLLRSKSKIVVAVGSCACSGGIPALANLTTRDEIFRVSYHESPTVINPEKTEPARETTEDGVTVTLPGFYKKVLRLQDVIDVDYFLPGCPPTAEKVGEAVGVLLSGNLPQKGAVLLPDRALCYSCSRNASKPDNLTVTAFKRITEVKADPEKCFLAQGIACMGISTRDGCGEPCIKGNMPCTGCFGPTSACKDQGAKMVSSLGAMVEADTPEAAAIALSGIADPAGTFYRYGLSASLMRSSEKRS